MRKMIAMLLALLLAASLPAFALTGGPIGSISGPDGVLFGSAPIGDSAGESGDGTVEYKPLVCEELGFIGAAIIILLFAFLFIRGLQIAMKTNDRFASLTVIGIVSQVAIQTVFNILVVTDTIPNTGIALPFFSYGGTSILMLLFEMGIVLSISRKANQKKV